MRWLWVLLALSISTVKAQLPALTERAVIIRAEVRQVDQRLTLWSASWGSYQKEFSHKRALEVRLKALGTFNPQVTITWAFIGSEINDGNRFVVVGGGERNTTIPRNGDLEFALESPEFAGKDTKLNALKTRDREGVVPAGWAIMIWQDKRYVSGQGSTPEMLDFARRNTEPPGAAKKKKEQKRVSGSAKVQ